MGCVGLVTYLVGASSRFVMVPILGNGEDAVQPHSGFERMTSFFARVTSGPGDLMLEEVASQTDHF